MTTPLTKSDIRYFDFGRPVLDFIIGIDGIIWVLLDARWADAADPMDTVRLVRWDSIMQEVCRYSRLTDNCCLHTCIV